MRTRLTHEPAGEMNSERLKLEAGACEMREKEKERGRERERERGRNEI